MIIMFSYVGKLISIMAMFFTIVDREGFNSA